MIINFIIIYSMKSNKNIFRKLYDYFNKQRCFAHTIFGLFIVICMIIVLSFETIGLARKEMNIDYRIITPETSKVNYFVIL